MPAYAILALAIIGEVIATTALKASEGFTKLVPSLIVLVGYGAAFFFLSQVLDRIPVGIAYAVWAGGGIVLIAALAWIVYGQRPDFWGFAGMGLILAGVLVLNCFPRRPRISRSAGKQKGRSKLRPFRIVRSISGLLRLPARTGRRLPQIVRPRPLSQGRR